MKRPERVVAVFTVVLAAVWVVVLAGGCVEGGSKQWASYEFPGATPGVKKRGALGPTAPAVSMFSQEPSVRIRIGRSASAVSVGGAVVTVTPAGSPGAQMRGPVRFSRSGGVWRIEDSAGGVMRFRGAVLSVATSGASQTDVDGAAYPGAIALRSAKGADGLDVINTVGMEQYLPGVLERELYGSWAPAAFEAQAVAARSYALWEVSRARALGKAFDLESTTASQAYVGVAKNPKTTDAVNKTRGRVLVYEGKVVPAFYSSAHGRLGADGAQVFPGRSPDIAPLRGRVHGTRDQASPRFHWEASRSAPGLAKRLVAWGRANDHAVAGVRSAVRNIEVTGRNSVGRHAAYTVTDAAGQRFVIRADSLRHAANTAALGAEKPGKGQTLYSGQFVPVVAGEAVKFTQGQGHGHGVGMSQFGAQGMAKQGHGYPAILGAYYPGAVVERIY